MPITVSLVIATIVATAGFSEATTMQGIRAGCVFSKSLQPYRSPPSYNQSTVVLNGHNVPILLYNGPGPYAYDIPFDTAGAGLIGRLPDNTQLDGLQNIEAFQMAGDWAQYQNATLVGSTFYGIASMELLGGAQFAFQVTHFEESTGAITVDVGAFMINTNYNDCVFSDRNSTLSRSCDQKWTTQSIACNDGDANTR
eukprot:TRINITY_DN7825_c0_g1_i4.p1 TRINITY_DN7825_c0_g1~~TRINITY_DN7825_c0_g1_i4.p1  ORF type:complete len:197 (-),score=28.82 TRINITY_DN7825_c0_g1_i4:163-753(-)